MGEGKAGCKSKWGRVKQGDKFKWGRVKQTFHLTSECECTEDEVD